MKKTFSLLTVISLLTFQSLSADFIAGWDFSSFSMDNYSSQDSSTIYTSIESNYADTTPSYNNGRGNITFGGISLGDGDAGPQSANKLSLNSYAVMGQSGSLTALSGQGQTNATDRSFTFTSDASGGTLSINMTGIADWTTLTFASQGISGGTSTISWAAGGSSLGSTTIGASESVQTVDISSLAGSQDITLVGTLGTIPSGLTYIDNIAVSGTSYAIPEPSTYALLVGFASFLFIAIRRRRA